MKASFIILTVKLAYSHLTSNNVLDLNVHHALMMEAKTVFELANSMEQRSIWEAHSFWASQEVFLAYYETWSSITLFKTARHWSHPRTHSPTLFLTSVLILFSHLRLRLLSACLPWGYSTNTFYVFHLSLVLHVPLIGQFSQYLARNTNHEISHYAVLSCLSIVLNYLMTFLNSRD